MKDTQKLGQLGEARAVDYLEREGYLILEQNWKWKRAEIDLITRYKGLLVFVEVKLRSYDYFGHPATGLDQAQKARISDAANAYMIEKQYEGEIRFDLVTLLLNPTSRQWEIEHFEDYFFPGAF